MNAAKGIIMGYRMQLGGNVINVAGDFFSPGLLEHTSYLREGSNIVELKDVSLNHFHLTWGKHSTGDAHRFSINFDHSFYVSHFMLDNQVYGKPKNTTAALLPTYKTSYQDKSQAETGMLEGPQSCTFF